MIEEIKKILCRNCEFVGVCGEEQCQLDTNNQAEDIDALFPKGDKDGLLTGVETVKALGGSFTSSKYFRWKHIQMLKEAQQALTIRLKDEEFGEALVEIKNFNDNLIERYRDEIIFLNQKHQKEIAEAKARGVREYIEQLKDVQEKHIV